MLITRVYIRLLDEGTDVSRPAEAEDLGDGLYRVLAYAGYDPEHELWEFLPGSVVRCERKQGDNGDYLLATEQVEEAP